MAVSLPCCFSRDRETVVGLADLAEVTRPGMPVEECLAFQDHTAQGGLEARLEHRDPGIQEEHLASQARKNQEVP